jgi:hypothetical protein
MSPISLVVSSPTGINVEVLSDQMLPNCNEITGQSCGVSNVAYVFDQTSNATLLPSAASGILTYPLLKKKTQIFYPQH